MVLMVIVRLEPIRIKIISLDSSLSYNCNGKMKGLKGSRPSCLVNEIILKIVILLQIQLDVVDLWSYGPLWEKPILASRTRARLPDDSSLSSVHSIIRLYVVSSLY